MLKTIANRLFHLIVRLVQRLRVLMYKLYSNCRVSGTPTLAQPVQFVGSGEIHFSGHVTIGFFPSPFYLNGYSYIEARNISAKVRIEDGTWINNNFTAISEHKGIFIGRNVLIGTNVKIYDSDFHGLSPDARNVSRIEDSKEVVIEDNVFIGSNVKILKGVKIGRNSVIANSSIVVKDIPPGVIAGGNPAKVLKEL